MQEDTVSDTPVVQNVAPEAPLTDNDSVEAIDPESAAETTADNLDRKLKNENQSLRKRLRDIETLLKEKEEAELSETERMRRRVLELEETITVKEQVARDARLRADIIAQASTLGIVDVDAAALLLDKNALDYDSDSDSWNGVQEALRALAQERPWLVSNAASVASGANPTNAPMRRTRLTQEALSKMSKAEIASLAWEDVEAALSNN